MADSNITAPQFYNLQMEAKQVLLEAVRNLIALEERTPVPVRIEHADTMVRLRALRAVIESHANIPIPPKR